jgi:hypothetical protein
LNKSYFAAGDRNVGIGPYIKVKGQDKYLYRAAWRTLQGIEAVHKIRKGRVRWVAKGDAVAQSRFIAELFGIAA